MDDFGNGGGVIVDISGLQKPAKYQPIIKRTHQYIQAMIYAKKPIDSIMMGAEDYDGILRHLINDAKNTQCPMLPGFVSVKSP